ncbi:MAG: YaaA family protein [Epsilonproteobacteria bacterium]|nr:YaaA family protein [Campylobacterota bacterium]
MKILFAPSEAKSLGGDDEKREFCFDIDRNEILKTYDYFVKNANKESLKKLFGTKELLDIDIFNSPTKKAIKRYTGVAYEYLDYASLDEEAKIFLENNLIIFSNLFGMLCAKDKIPFYKLKQGEAIGDLKPEKYYKEKCKNIKIEDEILDLRAGFYEKFYKPPFCVKMKFLKNGKTVSHWAKAYRGKIAREIAKNQIDTFQKLKSHPFKDLKLIEIQQKRDHEMWIFEIVE